MKTNLRDTILRTVCAVSAVMMIGTGIASADIIADRKAGFRGNVAALKAIRAAMAENDTATIAANAEKMVKWFSVMPEYFPEGSGQGDTNAKPEIWTNWDKFVSITASAEAAARDLATAAKAGDMDAVSNGFKVTAGTCKTCHQSFKN